MLYFLYLLLSLLNCFSLIFCLPKDNVQLTTTNNNFMSMIAGFTARMQCSLYRCGNSDRFPNPIMAWYKDDVLIFNGTEFVPSSGFEPSKIVLQRSAPSPAEMVSESQDDCTNEEYTLLLKNLTRQDAGEYRCQLINYSQQLDFHLDVLDSGLTAGFHENYTYDYRECCLEKGISPLCRSMCKPRDMHLEFFDPTSCKTNDFRNFLQCATDNGRRNYIPCCRQRSIPSFCFDFCSNNFDMLKRSHRLCLYYLPEIFECFSKQYALYPPLAPTNLRVDGLKHKICWKGSSHNLLKPEEVGYAVHVKEVPEMMLRGSSAIINENKLGTGTRKRSRRDSGTIVLVSEVDKNSHFIKLKPFNLERLSNSKICFLWNNLLRNNTRYVVYVQASNDYGASEPSQPLFITTTIKSN